MNGSAVQRLRILQISISGNTAPDVLTLQGVENPASAGATETVQRGHRSVCVCGACLNCRKEAEFGMHSKKLSRRRVLAGLGMLSSSCGLFGLFPSHAQTRENASALPVPAGRRSHAIPLIGDPRYPRAFSHFDGVEPNAPKGGRIRLTTIGSFDSLNPFILQGAAARGILGIYDALMKPAIDDPETLYPLVAREVEFAGSGQSVIFHLDPSARFHDGAPVTAEDVCYSFELLRTKGHPQYRQIFKGIIAAEKVDPLTIRFTYEAEGARELPSMLGQLVNVLPKHFWEARGAGRDFERSSLELPLGSGPYRVGQVEAGRYIEYERVNTYWAEKLPSNIGQNNFDRVRYDFYFDFQVARTAFLGGASDVRIEMSPKSWATGYDVPQVKSGRVKRMLIPDDSPNGMSGLFFNLRHSKFSDVRVRDALIHAFDFEWINRHLLYDSSKRLNSYFENSELAATGKPSVGELALLDRFRGQLPQGLFEAGYKCPSTNGLGDNRANLNRAMQLFRSAGYEIRNGQMTSKLTGEVFSIEFLLDEPSSERIIQSYLADLKKIGVGGTIRVVDPSQYRNRLKTFDFDIIDDWKRVSRSPGYEMVHMFGAASADRPGSGNVAGLKSQVVDALVQEIVGANDRTSLVAATRALDRVLMWERICIPQWHMAGFPCAYWDRFGMPEAPLHLSGLPSTWWEAQPAQTESMG